MGVSQEVKKAADKVARNAEPMAQKATDAVLEQTDKVSTTAWKCKLVNKFTIDQEQAD